MKFYVSKVYDGGWASADYSFKTRKEARECFNKLVKEAKKEIYKKNFVTKNYESKLIEVDYYYFPNEDGTGASENIDYKRIERY